MTMTNKQAAFIAAASYYGGTRKGFGYGPIDVKNVRDIAEDFEAELNDFDPESAPEHV